MDDTTSRLAIYLMVFWAMLLVVGGLFKESLLLDQTDVYSPDENSFTDNVYQNENARGNLIIQVMSFQLTDKVPIMLSVFLNVMVLFTVYVLYMVLHPLK